MRGFAARLDRLENESAPGNAFIVYYFDGHKEDESEGIRQQARAKYLSDGGDPDRNLYFLAIKDLGGPHGQHHWYY